MLVWVGFTQVKARVIEWADIDRKFPSAILVACPKCKVISWTKVSSLFLAYDRTTYNFKCKSCGACKLKPGEKTEINFSSFKPRQPGWRSLQEDNNASKKPKNRTPSRSSKKDQQS